MQLSVIIGLVFGFIIAFFAVLNTEAVTLNYYFGQVNASVALLVLASAAMGALAVGLLGLVSQVRTGFALWGYRNKLQQLTKEVDGLKEQKRALYDDLSFLNAECELAVRKKEIELEENHKTAEEQSFQDVEQSEEKQNDEF